MREKRAAISKNAPSTSEEFETSQRTTSACPRCDLGDGIRGGEIVVEQRSRPAREEPAMLAPMPEPAPVTIATCRRAETGSKRPPRRDKANSMLVEHHSSHRITITAAGRAPIVRSFSMSLVRLGPVTKSVDEARTRARACFHRFTESATAASCAQRNGRGNRLTDRTAGRRGQHESSRRRHREIDGSDAGVGLGAECAKDRGRSVAARPGRATELVPERAQWESRELGAGRADDPRGSDSRQLRSQCGPHVMDRAHGHDHAAHGLELAAKTRGERRAIDGLRAQRIRAMEFGHTDLVATRRDARSIGPGAAR